MGQPMTDNDGQGRCIKRFKSGFALTIGMFALVAIYATIFVGPVIAAYLIVKLTVDMNSGVIQAGAFALLAVPLYAVSIGIAEALGLLDLDNSTGRVPPK